MPSMHNAQFIVEYKTEKKILPCVCCHFFIFNYVYVYMCVFVQVCAHE